LSDLARGLGVDEPAAEDVLQELESDLSAADRGWQIRDALMASGSSRSRSLQDCQGCDP